MSGNPLYAAGQVQHMANNACNEKLAFALTGLSVALIGVMAAKECMGLFREITEHHRQHNPSQGYCR